MSQSLGGPRASRVRPLTSPFDATVPSENWDDDFEFSQNNSNSPQPKDARKTDRLAAGPLVPRQSVASSHFSEDWDADVPKQPSPVKAPVAGTSKMGGITSRLGNWAETGPSTPTKHGTQENWDDDFEDKADSPPNRRRHAHRASHHTFQIHNHHAHLLRTRHSYHTPPRPKIPVEPENWDDDFDDPTSATSPSKHDNDNTPVTKRTRREAYAETSDEDDDADFGFSEDKEEDKTVTARSRTAPMTRPGSSNSHSHASLRHSPPPPVPALPQALSSTIEPFPRSPTVSVFSIPTTSGRNSIGYFNSSSHLALSGASSLAMLPPSPPIQRERRRLRKKSRPPHIDNNVFELIEEQRDSSPTPLPPSTPERASSPPMLPMHSSPVDATPGGSKSPLLSRIGSVKKWGTRRKRASTGPAEVAMQDVGGSNGGIMDEASSRPPSALEQTPVQASSNRNRNSRSTWFFRPGGAHYGAGSPPPRQAELKHEKSLDQAQLRPGAAVGGNEGGQVPTTPSKNAKLSKRKASGPLEHASSGELTGDGSSSTSGVMGLGKPSLGPSRRPSSMQVPSIASLAGIAGSNRFASVGTRHASYGSSVSRASASRVFSTPTPTESIELLPPMPALPSQEGSRSFMGSVRKISLVSGKKHKKKKSSLEVGHAAPGLTDSLQDDDNDREQDADGDVRMRSELQAPIHDLLPPIELHPPSPPRTINGTSANRTIQLGMSDGNEPLMVSMSAPVPMSISFMAPSASSATSVKPTPKSPSSPQSASLGRTTQVPSPPHTNPSVPRRNSLGDLKIPARISQAQIGLKRDLGMVREFATSVDRLKELQSTYQSLLAEAQTFLESAPPSRATSPNVFNLVRPRSRLRSNTSPSTNTSPVPVASGSFSEYKHFASTFYAITVKYKVSWECAELLVELGGGAPAPSSPLASGPSPSLSAPPMSVQSDLDLRKSRERAITLSGEESKPPPEVPLIGAATASSTSGPSNALWRASTGRHDLSQRQLVLLRDMLSYEPPSDDLPSADEHVNKHWRWGDAMSSTVTLPSEESETRADRGEKEKKKRRSGKMGLTGLRDMLRMLKRSHSEQTTATVATLPADPSTVSLSTESSHYSHYYAHGQLCGIGVQQRPKTSAGHESVRSTKDVPAHSPYGPPLNHKSSPRRPSLASIFRIGQKHKGGASSSAGGSSQDSRSDVRSASRGSDMTGEDDWDRIESAIDLDGAARVLGIEGTATVKGRSKGRASPFLSESSAGYAGHRPVTPRRGQDAAQQAVRIEVEASPRSVRPMRSTRLSNVEEVEDGERHVRSDAAVVKHPVSLRRVSPHRPPSRGQPIPGSSRMGSVRIAPPQPPPLTMHPPDALSDIKLSMTPENIRPLLENAKEVHTRCHECIRELRTLLDAGSS